MRERAYRKNKKNATEVINMIEKESFGGLKGAEGIYQKKQNRQKVGK